MRACATGSPASTRSTKLTPLTTRPSFTSRHGMTRIFSIGSRRDRERGFEADARVVEGTAEDRALDAVGFMRLQRFQIIERGDAARGDHRRLELARKLGGLLDIDAGQHAVALDIGEDDRGDTRILKAQGEVERAHRRGRGPAFDRDLAAARIDADRDAIREELAGAANEIRVFQGCRAENDARDAAIEPGFDGLKLANAAAELNRDAHDIEDRRDALLVHRLAGKGAVEIDDMEPLAAGRGEALRLRGWIAVEDGRGAHLALYETHAAPFLQIDRGVEDHTFPLVRASRFK